MSRQIWSDIIERIKTCPLLPCEEHCDYLESKYTVSERKEKKSLETRQNDFALTLKPFVNQYGREMIIEFFRYWTEPNQTKKRMRFELQKTWDAERRLITWSNNNKKFNNATSQKRNELDELLNQSLATLQGD